MSTNKTNATDWQSDLSAALQDSIQCWNRLPHKLFFGILFAAWLLLFQFYGNGTFGYVNTSSLMVWMHNAYTNSATDGQDGQGEIVPLVVAFLLWWKRKELLAVPARLWWPGLVMMVAALLLHVCGYEIQQPRISIVALFLGIYGLVGLTWGPGWLRETFFPFILFVFCIPISTISEPVTFPLRLFVASATAFISQHLLGIHVIREGTQLFDAARTYGYDVAAACSGIQSLMAIIGLNTVFAFLFLKSNPRRMLLIAAALPLALVGNCLRLLFVIVSADFFGREIGDFVHHNFFFSLLPYLPAFAGVWFMGRWLEQPGESAAPSGPVASPKPNPA